MNHNRDKFEIEIDESELRVVPGFFQRLRNAIIAVGMGIVFAQVMLFAFRFYGSVISWWNNIIFISYLIICAIMGWILGDKFSLTLREKIGDWWDLWNFWK